MADTLTERVHTADGIFPGITFDDYLKTDRVSKSGLWTLHTRSPAHARVDKEESNAMKLGTAIHCAVLEPDHFTERFYRGPDDRRGNKWKDALEEWGDRLLTSGDYDAALEIRDRMLVEPIIKRLVGSDTIREVTAFATDPATGLKMRMRADAYSPHVGILTDLKMTNDARPDAFQRTVAMFGYHLQERHYSDVWKLAGGDFKTFVFAVVEPNPPYALKVYELNADAIEEGRAVRAKAMARWAECEESGVWPGYDTAPEVIGLRKYDYRETVPAEVA